MKRTRLYPFLFCLWIMLPTGVQAQDMAPTDPYGDAITTVENIDPELFFEVVEEIVMEEDEEFANIAGEELDYDAYGGIRTFENNIDMPAQFSSSLVHNEKMEDIRAIYTLGPSDELDMETAKAWYDGLVALFAAGNEQHEWGLEMKTEQNVAGLPERTTFFLFEDDYSSLYIEIYYTAQHAITKSRVDILFIFPQ